MFTVDRLADPSYFAENRLPAHSDHVAYADALELASGVSSLRRSLNGLWYFHYARNLAARPQGFEQPDYDVSGWETIRVPAHWQMEGHGVPQYTNQVYPWDGHEVVHPGQVPKRDNPVGSYVKDFILPDGWDNAVLSLQGVESAVAVYLNGQYVGYSEDSFTPSDFDLTPYLKEGTNRLAMQVFRFSSGSWLEDQDFWRFSGVFREVLLYTKPKMHLDDLRVTAQPIHDYKDGKLHLDMKWNNPAAHKVRMELFDATFNEDCYLSELQEVEGLTSSFEAEVEGIELWSAEHPNLYRAIITVEDEEGHLQEVIQQNIGFREFRMEDGLMKLNGKRIVFKGTNRHEFDCYRGRAIDPAEIEKDIIVMKQHNINALRCSHYPNSSYIYDLCDRYGLYVIDETNLETHGTWMRNGKRDIIDETLPNDHEEWQDIILDRAKSMFERDKNHTAILIWSCGNESCGGKDLYEMSEYFRHADPTRLVHYENIFWDRRYNGTSDMESQMYPPVADIKKFLSEHRDKPFICCEYTHAMGNSIGGMHKYTDLTDEEPLYQGGFIWDFVDQAIWHKDRYGKDAYGYGGDFGDRPNDGNFSGDGILFADRSLTTKMQEVKFNYQNFTLAVEADKVTIHNKSLFTNVSEYELYLTVQLDGEKIWEDHRYAPDIKPGESGEVALEDLPITGAGEETVTASLRLKEDTLWAKQGFEVAFGQGTWQVDEVEVPEPQAIVEAAELRNDTREFHYTPNMPLETRPEKPLHIVHGDINLGVRGVGFEIMFSSAFGNLTSYKYNGVELIEEAPKLSFWRAPVDNDYGSRRDFAVAQWKLASLYRRCIKKELMDEEGNWQEFDWFGQLGQREYDASFIKLRFTYELATQPAAICSMTYTVTRDGSVKVELDYDKVEGLPEIPDFAMLFTLSADYAKVRFYGYGPLDNYADRQRGVKLGIYETTAKDEVEPYLLPQETGNHDGVRWIEAVDNRGRGLRLSMDETPFAASALPYTAHELENARHAYDLPEVHHTYLRASLGQCGVGGDNTWGAPILPEYTVKNETKHFSFFFKGI